MRDASLRDEWQPYSNSLGLGDVTEFGESQFLGVSNFINLGIFDGL